MRQGERLSLLGAFLVLKLRILTGESSLGLERRLEGELSNLSVFLVKSCTLIEKKRPGKCQKSYLSLSEK